MLQGASTTSSCTTQSVLQSVVENKVQPVYELGEGEEEPDESLSLWCSSAACKVSNLNLDCKMAGAGCILFNLVFVWYLMKWVRDHKHGDSARGRAGVKEQMS